MSNLGQNILFLDDSPDRIYKAKQLWPACIVVTTATDCIEQLKKRDWVNVLLDHDLGQEEYVNSGREDCGMEVVRFIVANKPRINSVVVHSHNAPAAAVMNHELVKAGYDSRIIRFGEGPLWKIK